MRILIIAASNLEINYLFNRYQTSDIIKDVLYKFKVKESEIFVLISGLGMAFASYNLTKILVEYDFDYAINIGIAGAFSKINIGEIVHVTEDEFADLGIEDNTGFKTLFEERLIKKDTIPFENGRLINRIELESDIIEKLPKVKGVTVNKVSGYEKTIKGIIDKYNPDIETMEGAAIFYICMMENLPCLQIRGISNWVEARNKNRWNIPLALKNLETFITDFLEEFR